MLLTSGDIVNKAQFLNKIRRREAVAYNPHHWQIAFRKFSPLSLVQWQVNLAKLVELPYCGFCDGLEQKVIASWHKALRCIPPHQDMTRLLRRGLTVGSQHKQSRGLVPAVDWSGDLLDKCDRVLFHRRKNRATMKTQKENEVTVFSLKKKKKKRPDFEYTT